MKITIPIAPTQKSIFNNSETTIPPAYIVTETFVKTYANSEKTERKTETKDVDRIYNRKKRRLMFRLQHFCWPSVCPSP
mgnify:CR=1 FL=1